MVLPSIWRLAALGWAAQVAGLPSNVQSGSLNTRQACTNTPTTRNCWSNGFSSSTDITTDWPKTGQTNTYDLRITNTTCSPDGHSTKMCQLINGQYPGPTIRANWGDRLRIVVHNDMPDNGTSIHWHGFRQLNTCQNDGTNGITECPIAPGSTKTYEFVATQYGTTWYHSHHSAQYGEGVVGTVIIDGPTTANYDVDLGTLPLTDWYYNQTWMLLSRVVNFGAVPQPDTILVNGTMVDGAGNGHYQTLNVQTGKKYKFRLINTSVDQQLHVSLDNHPFTVVAADFVAIKPFNTTDLMIGIGQRYEVIITADQAVDNYWLRVTSGTQCNGAPRIYGNTSLVVGGILHYEGASSSNPTSTSFNISTDCLDESFEPFVEHTVPSDTFASQLGELDLSFDRTIIRWSIDGSPIDVDWERPTLDYVQDNDTAYTTSMRVFEMTQPNAWYFWVIRNFDGIPIPHPIHLHGHDFYKLGSGTGDFPGTISALDFDNPIRRDVAMLPARGWLVIAMPADNPGAWLCHCHIAWHVSQGFGLQFLERKQDILGAIGSLDSMNEGCIEWERYWDSPNRPYKKEDSGLRSVGPTDISGPGAGV
ncbi:laccase precursor [Trichodelitschia bisporula]|uniref:laccase n=1 Tax=Trichodelitschia bisporula TaxID=703511 RepID=A0A6G1HQ97_9PEZI|nr:laccase precursor [Trichodelitschia bisporula]